MKEYVVQYEGKQWRVEPFLDGAYIEQVPGFKMSDGREATQFRLERSGTTENYKWYLDHGVMPTHISSQLEGVYRDWAKNGGKGK